MIPNDSINNYFFIRKKMFRINRNIPGVKKVALQQWNKSTFYDDFPKEKIKEVIQYETPKELPSELVFPYIDYLEMKTYRWQDLAFVKD